MSDQFPNSFETPRLVLPEMVARKFLPPLTLLHDNGYDILLGISEAEVPQLTEIANQDGTLEYCPNDAETRWKDVDSARRQLAKDGGRAIMRLVARDDGRIMGFGWTGPISEAGKEQLPRCSTTFAIRLHENARGRHLATPFTRSILAVSKRFESVGMIGLETWASNERAVSAYLSAGAELVSVKADIRPTRQRGDHVFLHEGAPSVSDTRHFMQFPHTADYRYAL